MRRLLPVVVIAGLVFMAGCTSSEPTSLRGTPWPDVAGRDLGCRGKVVVVSQDYYDVNHDGDEEAFVAMRCVDKYQPDGDQLEVFSGRSDPRWKPISVLVYQRDGVTLASRVYLGKDEVIYPGTANGKSVVRAARWSKGNFVAVRCELPGCVD
jgi:hypothetical protein